MVEKTEWEQVLSVASKMAFEGEFLDCEPLGAGHINKTYSVRYRQADDSVRTYVLQQINDSIFDVAQLMANIVAVTSFLKQKIEAEGGDPTRETLNLIPTKQGEQYYCDSQGKSWRAYDFVRDSVCYERAENPKLFYESAIGFGRFQRRLADFPVEQLHEILPDFHNTPKRLEALKAAIEADPLGRVATARQEIAFVMQRAQETGILVELCRRGNIPLRVTHNDTKLNNAMFDRRTGKVICIIDLDTVMPGLSLYDFGDSIRFGASTAAEDERDLKKVQFDLRLFDVYTKGYLEGTANTLTDWEIEMMPMGAKLATLECGIRFLTDYILGDVYFRIDRPEQNLDRCRTQFKLVRQMEEKWEKMRRIVAQHKYSMRKQ